jgi:hypothetical protein
VAGKANSDKVFAQLAVDLIVKICAMKRVRKTLARQLARDIGA